MMIKITENIQLKIITKEECRDLFTLMKEIYQLAYSHFWEDDGEWYLNSQYSKENILKELLQQNAEYYFILYKNEIIGNFRFIWDEKLTEISEEKQLKLHRIYLHPKTQGKGIGNQLMIWLETKAQQKDYKIIWLDAMDEKPQAFQFYKKLGYNYTSHTFLPFKLMYKKYRKMSQLYKRIT